MTPDLLTIGDFARAVGLSASALRHYDECGLLVPARTDQATGYRYYTPDLERRARLVAMMREVGVPIEAMRVVLDGTPDEADDVLTGLTSDQEQRTSRTRDVLDTVRATLDLARTSGLVRVRVDGPGLAAALRQVRAAADRDPTSPLAAVLVDAQGEAVDVVATNRYWMACSTVRGTAELAGDARAAIALPDVTGLAEVLDRTTDAALVLTGDGLTVEDGDDLTRVATSARPYPAHRLILAGLEPATTTALVERDRFVAAVAGAGRSVVGFGVADDRVEVSGGGAVPAVVRGKPQELSFRAALLLRAAGACLGARVRVELTEPTRPLRISSPEQPGFVALAMPTLEA